jgi:hypothetical protein
LGKPGQQEQKMNDEIMKQTTPLTKKGRYGKEKHNSCQHGGEY